MDGTDVFTFSISEVPKLLKEHLVWRGNTPDDYDCYVLHQANSFILQQITKKAKLDSGKMLNSMEYFGNTSVASIPLTLCNAYANKKDRLRALLCGFGVGLSWGVIDAVIDSAHIYPLIETDDYYMDGDIIHD